MELGFALDAELEAAFSALAYVTEFVDFCRPLTLFVWAPAVIRHLIDGFVDGEKSNFMD